MSAGIYRRAFQWFADGTEAGSVPLASANIAPAVAPNSLVLLRLAIDAPGGSASVVSPKIQVCDQSSGTYVDLGSFGVNGFSGGTTPGGLLNNIACTNRLAGNGTWQAGGNTTTVANGTVNNVTINSVYFINYLFAIQIGNIPGGMRFFKLAHSGSAITFTSIGQITVAAALPKLSNTLLSGGLLSPLVLPGRLLIMARTGFRGIDIRQTSAGKLIIRASIKDSSGVAVTAGSPTCRIVEIQDDGTFTTLEWNVSGQYTFKTSPITPTSPTSGGAAAGVVTHQALGLWTCAIPNTSAFVKGAIYVAILSGGTGAFPAQQEREFQWGDADGDFSVGAAKDASSFAIAGDAMNFTMPPNKGLRSCPAPRSSACRNKWSSWPREPIATLPEPMPIPDTAVRPAGRSISLPIRNSNCILMEVGSCTMTAPLVLARHERFSRRHV